MFAIVIFLLICSSIVTFLLEFHLEAPCNAAGGICALAEHCPLKIEQKYLGLCPQQRSKGAECCHGSKCFFFFFLWKNAIFYAVFFAVPKNLEHQCKSHGGECINECPIIARRLQVTDCPANQHCCVWFN